MSFGNTTESDILGLLFNATPIANVADNASSSPYTSVEVSLHTGDPGEGGNQTTNEANYTGYARVAIARDGTGWTVSGTTQVANAVAITFPACTAGSSTVTYACAGWAHTGTGKIIGSGPLTSPSSIAVSAGITPSFAIGAVVLALD